MTNDDNNKMSSNIISGRMENIRIVFQDSKRFASEYENIDTLIKHLENLDSESRSVAYEGASMSLALKDFFAGNSLTLWNSLLSVSSQHAGQIHIGLGWAIAEAKPDDLSFMNSINPKIEFRVWDGCGYYDGLFRQRQTIKNQTRQEYVSEKNFKAYDEGIGRSVWYNCKGDAIKVAEMIQTFSPPRHHDLWRGVGIACSYVGGGDESILKNIFSLAEKNAVQLCIGTSMVAKSRSLANTVTKDIELACNVWCHLSAHKAMVLAVKAESGGDSFESFLSQMEKYIMNAHGMA